ncbi:hypothetical protein [Rhodovibrio sodomensis]|nr:hypothetical protein [Rhodovibrio sodomensis]
MKPKFHLALLEDLREHEEEMLGSASNGAPQKLGEPMDATRLTRWIRALESSIHVGAESEQQAIAWLAGATSVGTAFWGFGDVLALWLREALIHWELVAAPVGAC